MINMCKVGSESMEVVCECRGLLGDRRGAQRLLARWRLLRDGADAVHGPQAHGRGRAAAHPGLGRPRAANGGAPLRARLREERDGAGARDDAGHRRPAGRERRRLVRADGRVDADHGRHGLLRRRLRRGLGVHGVRGGMQYRAELARASCW